MTHTFYAETTIFSDLSKQHHTLSGQGETISEALQNLHQRAVEFGKYVTVYSAQLTGKGSIVYNPDQPWNIYTTEEAYNAACI